ncbi:hypothetical protein ACWEVD_18405 [Nocardia thailandica]|uniref:DUF2631 domain-containing protein n=1 Tax=Nocardia thailandica TaxID=257275 RepID=A0ABW6PKQ8_9NOCA|nr:hypothetical protein [Nocardia thailandica]
MGAYSTTRPESAPSEPDSAPEEPVTAERAVAPAARSERTALAVVGRVLGWLFFVGGLVGAGLGIAGLHVEVTVAGLILACTAGLILLKLRADREPAAETD